MAPRDPYGRGSPRGLATGLIRALAAGDYERASQYFNLSTVPAGRRAAVGIEKARQLQDALDAGGSLIQPVQLSSEAVGRIDDQLPGNQERIGSLPSAKGSSEVPLIATAVSREGQTIWLISSASLATLHATPGVGGSALRDKLPAGLRETSVAGAPLADWLILIAGALFFYVLVRLVCTATITVLRRVHPLKEQGVSCQLLQRASSPLSLWISMLLFLGAIRTLEAAIVARQLASRVAGAIAFAGLAWLVWRMIDVAADLIAARMEHSQRFRARSIIIFMRRAVKLLLLMFAGVQALNILGIDVTTGIAALGLGGLAIALGAQKTVENVVGSVSIVVDEPVRIGDFCRVGDVSGTVEEIGIRSTRIRTNDRTRVTIPNGNLAALQIENFAARDRYLFAPTLRLAYGLDAGGVQRVLEALRAALTEADYLFEGARANFKGFGDSSLDFEIFGWIDVLDGTEAIYLQEKLLLEIMRRIESVGAGLAVPVRAVQISQGGEAGGLPIPHGEPGSQPDPVSASRGAADGR
jgi:MscS family membrane protein